MKYFRAKNFTKFYITNCNTMHYPWNFSLAKFQLTSVSYISFCNFSLSLSLKFLMESKKNSFCYEGGASSIKSYNKTSTEQSMTKVYSKLSKLLWKANLAYQDTADAEWQWYIRICTVLYASTPSFYGANNQYWHRLYLNSETCGTAMRLGIQRGISSCSRRQPQH